MALEIGSVSVDANGTPSGDGLAFELYEAEEEAAAQAPAIYEAVYGKSLGDGAGPKAALVNKRQQAARANALAAKIIGYLVNHVEVTVSGVQAGGDTVGGTIE